MKGEYVWLQKKVDLEKKFIWIPKKKKLELQINEFGFKKVVRISVGKGWIEIIVKGEFDLQKGFA